MTRYIPDSDDDEAPRHISSSRTLPTPASIIEQTPDVRQVDPTPDLPTAPVNRATSPTLKRKRESPRSIRDSQPSDPTSTIKFSDPGASKDKKRVKTKWEASSSDDDIVAVMPKGDENGDSGKDVEEVIPSLEETKKPAKREKTKKEPKKREKKVKTRTKSKKKDEDEVVVIPDPLDREIEITTLEEPEQIIPTIEISIEECPVPEPTPDPLPDPSPLLDRRESSTNIVKNYAVSKPISVRGPRPRVGLSRRQRVDPLLSLPKKS